MYSKTPFIPTYVPIYTTYNQCQCQCHEDISVGLIIFLAIILAAMTTIFLVAITAMIYDIFRD